MQGSVDALIVAAGKGSRYGKKKQFLPLAGTTVTAFTTEIFGSIPEIKNVVVVCPVDMSKEDFRKKAKLKDTVTVVPGGLKRADSVRNGLRKISSGYVLVHDAVRPAVSKRLIKEIIKAVKKYGAVVPALAAEDTVKYFNGKNPERLKRENVYIIQTPQGFVTEELIDAYERFREGEFTDSSSLMEASGRKVEIIDGEKYNIKITSPEDYRITKELVKK